MKNFAAVTSAYRGLILDYLNKKDEVIRDYDQELKKETPAHDFYLKAQEFKKRTNVLLDDLAQIKRYFYSLDKSSFVFEFRTVERLERLIDDLKAFRNRTEGAIEHFERVEESEEK